MRFTIFINQVRAIEWGLNLQQSALFSYLHDLPTWGKCVVIDGEAFWWSGKDKIIEELPILTDKPDTIKRHMAVLEKAGLIERTTHQNRAMVRVTEKGKLWNKSEEGREINPHQVGKNLPTKSGKKSLPSREKNPAYKNTSDQSTEISKEKSKPKSSGLDFSSWPSEPSEQIFKDWKAMRDKKRAPITQTVINRLASKLVAAGKQFGMSVDDVLGLCVERGWQGFEVEWLANLSRGKPQGVNYVGSDFTAPNGWEEFR